jgi:hypothetical protein
MDGEDSWEIKHILRRHEEIGQANNNAILVLTTKVVEIK